MQDQNRRALAGGAVENVGGYLRYAIQPSALGAGYLRTKLPGGTKVMLDAGRPSTKPAPGTSMPVTPC